MIELSKEDWVNNFTDSGIISLTLKLFDLLTPKGVLEYVKINLDGEVYEFTDKLNKLLNESTYDCNDWIGYDEGNRFEPASGGYYDEIKVHIYINDIQLDISEYLKSSFIDNINEYESGVRL